MSETPKGHMILGECTLTVGNKCIDAAGTSSCVSCKSTVPNTLSFQTKGKVCDKCKPDFAEFLEMWKQLANGDKP